MNPAADRFWRENIRPGTTFMGHYKPPTLWQQFYDWITSRS